MKNIHLYLLLLLGISLFGCKDDEEPRPTKNKYIGCCDTEPVEFVESFSALYIPNAFTPNGDGINDLFTITTINIDFVQRFEIKDTNGDAVLTLFNFSVFNNPLEWDGAIDHFGNDAIIGGLYTYEIDFFTGYGIQKSLEGSVCAYVCDQNFPENKDNCLFNTQLSDEFGFNPDFDSQEGDCFQ